MDIHVYICKLGDLKNLIQLCGDGVTGLFLKGNTNKGQCTTETLTDDSPDKIWVWRGGGANMGGDEYSLFEVNQMYEKYHMKNTLPYGNNKKIYTVIW